MVITSPLPGEGKTTVASNLAAAMADTGKTILLVDGDLRKPRIHTVFGLAEGPGLYDLLKAERELSDDEILSHIQSTEVPGVSVLSAGNAELEEISRLLHSSRLAVLLDHLKKAYPIVLIDAPPLHQFPDARLLGGLADGAILVVRAGVTERESAVAAKDRLTHDGVRLIGTVLNDWQPDERSAKYGRYYSYYRQEKT
jgi:receptor protein-tyrosine kinase